MRVEILKVSEEKTAYESIFFNRPIGPLHRKNIGILVGKHTQLHQVEQAYSTVLALSHYPVIIAEDSLKEFNIPAEVFLDSKDKLHFDNTDEALSRLQDCHMIIAGIGLELTAAMQLFLERVLQTYHKPIILTESVFTFPTLTDYLGENTMLFGSTKGLLKLANLRTGTESGLARKIELLQTLNHATLTQLVCVEAHQVLGLGSYNADKISIVNCKQVLSKEAFLPLFAGLLADRAEPCAEGWLEYLLASGHLYEKCVSSKDYLKNLKAYLEKE